MRGEAAGDAASRGIVTVGDGGGLGVGRAGRRSDGEAGGAVILIVSEGETADDGVEGLRETEGGGVVSVFEFVSPVFRSGGIGSIRAGLEAAAGGVSGGFIVDGGRLVGEEAFFLAGGRIAIAVITVAEGDLHHIVGGIGGAFAIRVAERELAAGCIIGGGSGHAIGIGLTGEAAFLVPSVVQRVGTPVGSGGLADEAAADVELLGKDFPAGVGEADDAAQGIVTIIDGLSESVGRAVGTVQRIIKEIGPGGDDSPCIPPLGLVDVII